METKIGQLIKKNKIGLTLLKPNPEFYDIIGINQARWNLIVKGEAELTLWEMRNIASFFKIGTSELIATKNILTFDEAVLYTGFAKSTLYKLTADNVVPVYRPHGKKLFFKREELEYYLGNNPGYKKKT